MMATAYKQQRSVDADFEDALFDSIDKWIERDLRPVVMHHDHTDTWPEETVRQMTELGLFGATIGTDYGGLGLPATTYAKLVARIASYWMAPTGIFNSHLICAMAIEKFGTPEQRAKWLPKMASGEIRGGLALTEPDAGTDLQALRMQARKDGDGYVINGTKTWISNGIKGSVFALLVKTDPAAEPRYKGMSPVHRRQARRLPRRQEDREAGLQGDRFRRAGVRGLPIGRDQLIGGEEGHGFFQATGGLELGRINVAARGVGLAEGALRLATEYAQVRRTMGKPIAEHQAIQLKLGEMVTRARAARLLTLDAAEAYDRGERCDMEAGMAKYFASEAAVKNADEAMRIFGGYSYSKEYEIERYYRDAMLMCIGEGTNEMQRMIIAKQWVKRNPA
jgi:alkylation response protein AidB-like acyl-CoA dehydrogenase